MIRFYRYMIPFCCTYRNRNHVLQLKVFRKFTDILFNFFKPFFAVSNQIHLIHSKYKMTDSHQGTDSGMAPCLYKNPLLRVNQNNGQLCKGSSYRHVPCILLMSRSIRNDETPAVSRKITISNINRNSLLTFRHQSIEKK